MSSRDVSTEKLVPRARSGRDFGLVVGIDHYPRFRSLQGAAKDAIAFHTWMCDPDGGGVALEHARLITSTPEPPTPLQDHVDEQLVELVQAADALGGARRLYVYFSGHGATCTDGDGDDVALLLAKWSTTLARLALSSNRYCRALGGLGLFEEVAMFIDCCRTAVEGAVGMPPTFTCKATSEGSPARAFIAYATEARRPAFERPQEGVWYGIFTRRLLSILTRSPRGIEAAALKETLERELRESAVQRAHVVNGLRGGSTFGRRGVLPILEVRPDDEWEDFVELFDGTGQLVARHCPSAGTWTIPLAMGLYKLTYSVGGRQSKNLFDLCSGGSTRLDFRPKLLHPIVRAWSASTSDRWIPPRDLMQVFTLRRDEPMYVGSMPECASSIEPERSCDARIRYDDGCYVIEELGSRRPTLFHGRIRDGRGAFSLDGERIHTKQLRDGHLFRCGELRLMVGHVELDAPRLIGDIPHRARVSGSADLMFSGEGMYGGDRTTRATFSASQPQIAIGRLSLRCDPDVSVTVYDGTGAVRARSEGDLEISLPRGLYRIEAELCDRVTSHVFEIADDMGYALSMRPEISTPVVGISDAQSSQRPPAYTYRVENTIAPLGPAPHTSRLVVLLRGSPHRLPSEPISIHGKEGDPLAKLSRLVAPVFDGYRERQEWFMAFACAVAPGTYCLRTSHSRRNVAITIPTGYAARVFVADVSNRESGGLVRLDDMRVSLAPTSANLNDRGEIARAMEGVVAALRSPRRGLSEYARALLRTSVPADLCFGIAAAHLLRRAEDGAVLEEVLHALSPYADIPDVAILRHLYEVRAPEGDLVARHLAPDAVLALTTPPLMRASLQLAMTHPAFDLSGVPADSALARVACRGYADSIWCTWNHEGDERWIAPTVAELRRDETDVVALGRRLGIPPRRVQQALDELDARPSDTSRG